MKQPLSLLLAFTLTACGLPPNNSPETPSFHISALNIPGWAKLRVGAKVYLANDGLGPRDTQAVCATIDDYRQADKHQKAQCVHRRWGTAVTVSSIIPSRISDWFYPVPIAAVTPTDGSWTGYTSVLPLEPDIPIGTIIVATRKDYPVGLSPCQKFCANWGPDIGTNVRVRLLKYDPFKAEEYLQYVEVLDGKYAGKRGWLFDRDTLAAESVNSTQSISYGPFPELTAGFEHFGS